MEEIGLGSDAQMEHVDVYLTVLFSQAPQALLTKLEAAGWVRIEAVIRNHQITHNQSPRLVTPFSSSATQPLRFVESIH